MAGRLGLGVALRYAMSIGMKPIETRIRRLAGSLRERLDAEPGVSLMDLGRVENQCGIVSFSVSGVDASSIKQGLRLERVYVSTSSAESTPLDAEDRALPTVVSRVVLAKIAQRKFLNVGGGKAGKVCCTTLLSHVPWKGSCGRLFGVVAVAAL